MGFDPGALPRLNELDTVPPPEGGDAYGSATVVRAAPSEILEALRRERGDEGKAEAPAAHAEDKAIVAPETASSHSSGVEAPEDSAGEPAPAAKVAPLDPDPLKPPRVPEDFEKLMGQRAEDAVVPAKLPEPVPAVGNGSLEPSSRQTNTVRGVIAVGLVLWVTILAAVAISDFSGR